MSASERKRVLTFAVIIGLIALMMWILSRINSGGWYDVLKTVLTAYLIYCILCAFYWRAVVTRRVYSIGAEPGNLLIIAPHQDDGVAIGGGHALLTHAMGFEVHVLFLTDGPEEDKKTRKQEAVEAWSVMGLPEKNLHFLKHHTLSGFIDREEIDSGIGEIAEAVRRYEPDTLIVPLYEGGNYQHDVANYMVTMAVRKAGRNINVYEASEYNFFYSFRSTPEKMLSGLLRLIPFINHDYPPEPVRRDPVLHLKMSAEQIRIKREMLSRFLTQNPDRLVERFGFGDRYQKMHDYDYSKPPFNYDRSLARVLNALKKLPALGRFVSGAVKWTRTIHPDPDYTITRIPGLE